MKKLTLLFAAFFACHISMFAQGDCIIPMMVLVPEQVEELPASAHNTLESKLRQMVTQNGLDGGAKFSNFCIVAKISEGSKEFQSGTRPLVSLTVDLELFVGNNYTGDKFASTSVTINGAGRNEAKAFSSALAGVGSNHAQIQKFLNDTRRKINEYYETQVPNIILQAKSYAIRREYEEALCLLASVPTCCDQYYLVEQSMMEIFQEFVDYDCAVKVNKARAIWNASQNEDAAVLASAYLASIDPASSCWADALELVEQIRARIGDDWEFYKEIQRASVDLERARIEAIRAIGIAFGENQKSVTVRENWLVR